MHHFKAFDMINLQYEIKVWKKILNKATNDKNQHPPPLFSTLRLFLILFGFRFSPTFVQNLLAKYDPKTRRLSLDNFIVACVQIQRLTTSFKTRDREMRGQATMAYEDFIGIALGAHN